MSDTLQTVQAALLSPAGLSIERIESGLGDMFRYRLDYADAYFEAACVESWYLEEGIVKVATRTVERGVGVRAVTQAKTGFAYADEISLPAFLQAADMAKRIAPIGGRRHVKKTVLTEGLALYPACNPLDSLSESEKVSLLQSMDHYARSLDARVSRVEVSLSGVDEMMLVVGSDGTLAADVRPLVRLVVNVLVESKQHREHGSAGGGGRAGYDYFFTEDRARSYVRSAVREALINLEAQAAPAGTMPVVLGAGWPGVLLHEAVGHGLEADFNRKETSIYTGKIGEKVASPVCTLVDDGTVPHHRGSMNVDDEGTPGQCTVLIQDGVLKSYMQDKLNARLMKMPLTGNGRRDSYCSLPYPRMTNTYLLPGAYPPEEIIASVDKGLYAVNFSGGQVDITSGKFVFTTSEAYLIEHGKATTPVKRATLIGHGPEVLQCISMVGDDLQLDLGMGSCGKEGQSVPVGIGQPTLKVDALTVGGTE